MAAVMAFFSSFPNSGSSFWNCSISFRSFSNFSLYSQYPAIFINFKRPLLPKKQSAMTAYTSELPQLMPQSRMVFRGSRMVVWFCRKMHSTGMCGQLLRISEQIFAIGQSSLGPSTASLLPSGMQMESPHPPPRSRRTRWRVDSGWMLQSCRVRPSSSCLPAKMRRCWSGGMPSLSWMRSFISSMGMRMEVSISMVLPVRVFTQRTPSVACMVVSPSRAFFILRRQPSSLAALAFSLMTQIKPVNGHSTCCSILILTTAYLLSFVPYWASPSNSSFIAYLCSPGTSVSGASFITIFSLVSFSSSKQATSTVCWASSSAESGFLSLRKKVLSLPFLRMLGRRGQAVSKTFSGQVTWKFLISQEVMDSRRKMICRFISLLSMMKRCSPPPSMAPRRIISKLTPFPIPTACVVAMLPCRIFAMTLITWSEFETCPSVSRITCRTKSFISFSTWMMSSSGFTISVPPKSASKSSMLYTASSRCSSVQGTLLLNIRLNSEPKLMTLKREASGSDFRKRMRESFACWMRYPPIEPDRSSRKMYSPRQLSKFDLVDFFGKKVRFTHCCPSVQIGREKSACSKENSRSRSGGTAPPWREQLRKRSVKTVSSSLWEEDCAFRIFLELKRLILKSISVLARTQDSQRPGSASSSFLRRLVVRSSCVWQRGEMWEGIRNVHLSVSSLLSLPMRSNSMRTFSPGCRLPSRTFRTDFSEAEVTAIITVEPFYLASLYSAFTFFRSWTTPSTVRESQNATTRAMQKLGSVGMEQCISSARLKGLRQVCTDLISAKLFLMFTKYLLLMTGTRNFQLFSRKEQQKKALDYASD